MTRDYYVILGISRGADPGQIKQAYRKIAKQCHPDAAPAGDPHRFREVQEAYETLSDQNRRRRYDRATAPVPVPPAGELGMIHLHDLLGKGKFRFNQISMDHD